MKKIVLVEDEVYMREKLTELLKKYAYQVDVIDVIDAFDNTTEHILQLVPDLVLLDLNLPGISEFQLCQEIKRKTMLTLNMTQKIVAIPGKGYEIITNEVLYEQ